jgi:hypothetical protein
MSRPASSTRPVVRHSTAINGYFDQHQYFPLFAFEPAGHRRPADLCLDTSDARYVLLNKLQAVLRKLGYRSIVVIVDRVDEPHRVSATRRSCTG